LVYGVVGLLLPFVGIKIIDLVVSLIPLSFENRESTHLTDTVRQLITGLRVLALVTVILGIAFPVPVWGVAQVAFAEQADGSLIIRHGKVAAHASSDKTCRASYGSSPARQPVTTTAWPAAGPTWVPRTPV
jgi:hypothetical protein